MNPKVLIRNLRKTSNFAGLPNRPTSLPCKPSAVPIFHGRAQPLTGLGPTRQKLTHQCLVVNKRHKVDAFQLGLKRIRRSPRITTIFSSSLLFFVISVLWLPLQCNTPFSCLTAHIPSTLLHSFLLFHSSFQIST